MTQIVGALLRHGPQRLAGIEAELSRWLAEHEHATARELIGTMSQERCPDPAEYERAQYMRALHSYHPPEPEGEAVALEDSAFSP